MGRRRGREGIETEGEKERGSGGDREGGEALERGEGGQRGERGTEREGDRERGQWIHREREREREHTHPFRISFVYTSVVAIIYKN